MNPHQSKQLAQVDIISKHIVIGWIRQIQQQFNLSNVANLIKAYCILFYFINDNFEHCGEIMNIINTLNNKDTIIRRMKKYKELCFNDGSAFGQLNLNDNKFDCMIWTFQINRLQLWGWKAIYSNIFIGITNTKSTHLNKNVFRSDCTYDQNRLVYGISTKGHKIRMDKYKYYRDSTEDSFKEGDSIRMIFKRRDKKLKFKKNDNIRIATFKNVVLNNDTEVNMVITLQNHYRSKHVSITLSNFRIF